MTKKYKPDELHKVLVERFPELQNWDIFLSGSDIHLCLWGIQKPLESTLEFIGSQEEIPDFLIQSGIGYRVHPTLQDYESFLMSRPFNFQQYAYSIRLNSVFRGEIDSNPKGLDCSRRVDQLSDRKMLLNVCINLRQKLSAICSNTQFPSLTMQECIDAGLFTWLTEHSFVGYFLEDLCSGSYLEVDFQNWLQAGIEPLLWFEKEVQSRQGAWESLLDTKPQNRIRPLDLRSFKPGFLFQFLQTDFLDFSSLDQNFFNSLKERPHWWLNSLIGERLDHHMMSQWHRVFREDYLQGFILSCLKTLYLNDLKNYSWVRFMELIFEIFSEERIVLDFFQSTELEKPMESDEFFLHCMHFRWGGGIRSLRQFHGELQSFIREVQQQKKPASKDAGL